MTRAIAKYNPTLITVAWGPTPLGPAMASASLPAARTDAGGATVYPSDEVEAEMLAEEARS